MVQTSSRGWQVSNLPPRLRSPSLYPWLQPQHPPIIPTGGGDCQKSRTLARLVVTVRAEATAGIRGKRPMQLSYYAECQNANCCQNCEGNYKDNKLDEFPFRFFLLTWRFQQAIGRSPSFPLSIHARSGHKQRARRKPSTANAPREAPAPYSKHPAGRLRRAE